MFEIDAEDWLGSVYTFDLVKGGAGFESAISGRLVSPAIRPLNFFYFMSILGYLRPG